MASAALALALAGCTEVASSLKSAALDLGVPVPAAFDRTPPQVPVVRGGASGELLAGAAPPLLPEDAVDEVVSPGLKEWLTPLERRQLADASQQAAVAPTGAPVPWQAADAKGAATAAGAAVPVNNVFRSVSGRICRDVRQYVEKANEPHQRLVTLCREYHGDDLAIWVLAGRTRAAEQ
jgi:surface antigen